ncbi:hypothetical protein ACPPVW_01000 [Leifsonia sp. McL0607]|uniref:hypothetical protein n=1 Tax=Leifsonia sp. McL0607 TaxID=3415672 RepID=UPI003CEB0AF1
MLWLGRETEAPIGDIRREVRERKPDFVFIDDIDRFGNDSATLLRGLQNETDALVVVVGCRSGRYFQLKYENTISSDVHLEQDRLSNEDADSLLGQLARGNRLGALVALSHDERVRKIRERDDRQLLVTLIEATSGERFHDKVAGECRSLSGADLDIYGVVCTSAWADNKPLSRQDILFASSRSYPPNEGMAALQRLEHSHLLVAEKSGYRARHRVVAESAMDHFRSEGQLELWLVDLIFLVASHHQPANVRRTRYGRLLIRLVNHENLKKLVGDTSAVQRIYGTVEEWLSRDPHFWLQRGSFETTYGDLSSAENFLRQARALSPDDVWVDTAWSMLLMKKALRVPTAPDASVYAAEAFEIAIPIMKDTSKNAPHTFAVYLKYGLQWLRGRAGR